MPIPTAAPGAYKVFCELDGRDFPTATAFSNAYYATVRRLWGTLGMAFDNSDAVDWAIDRGVIQRDGDRVLIRVAAERPLH